MRHAAAAALIALALTGCRRDRGTPEELRAEIAALEQERDALRTRVDAMVVNDPRLQGMPATDVRVGIPTSLARELIEKVVAGVVDQVELVLSDLHVHKKGEVKKIVTLGEYELDVTIREVRGRLRTGKPDVRFGGNTVEIALPIDVVSGTGGARIHFTWDGRGVSSAVCGDLDITRDVAGAVKPARYPVSGKLVLSADEERIVATPRFPEITIRLEVVPSPESWAKVKAILDEKTGVCGFVLEKVDVLSIVRGLVARGFNVDLPTEKLKPMAVPVAIEPTILVRNRPLALGVTVGGLAITEHALWLGADVRVGGNVGKSLAVPKTR